MDRIIVGSDKVDYVLSSISMLAIAMGAKRGQTQAEHANEINKKTGCHLRRPPPLRIPLWMTRCPVKLSNIPLHLPYRISCKIPYRVPLLFPICVMYTPT